MIKTLKITTILLLAYTLIGAFYGGINLILYPDGSSIELSLDLLKHSPFNNFLIPGILLLLVNGVFCTFVLVATIFNHRDYVKLIIAQGAILTGWIIIQILLIKTIFYLQYVLGGIGIALIILGLLQQKKIKSQKPTNS